MDDETLAIDMLYRLERWIKKSDEALERLFTDDEAIDDERALQVIRFLRHKVTGHVIGKIAPNGIAVGNDTPLQG